MGDHLTSLHVNSSTMYG